jgi:alanine racemase
MSSFPNRVTIDLSALHHNLNQVRNLVGEEKRIMGVVKSDAYGHGMVPVARALRDFGADCLGVAQLGEALELRKAGVGGDIVVLSGIQTREDAREVVEKALTPLIYSRSTAQVIEEESSRARKRTAVHIKLDTGMGRLGIPCVDVGLFLNELKTFGSLRIEGLASHLSSADERDKGFTRTQIESFREAIRAGRSTGWELPCNSLANSAGIMNHRESYFELVRPGIMLYGGLPSPDFQSPVALKPVMRFQGRVLHIRDLPGGTAVSYGRTYTTGGPLKMAVLSAGYGAGLPRRLSNKGMVLIRGKRARIIGRVCMNLTMASLAGVAGVSPGDEVVFLGAQGGGTIRGDDMALWADTISYEIFCSIGRGNPRHYMK